MILQLAYYGDPVLRKKGAKISGIDDELRELVRDMIETMAAHKGIGLAAPQVHKSLALFITCIDKKGPDDKWIKGDLKVFVNPKIIAYSEEVSAMTEGCLSIPETYIDIVRPNSVTVEATDLDGNAFTEVFHGLDAHCVMHENDHINGVLHVDRYRGKDKSKLEKRLRMLKRKYQETIQ